MRHGIQTTSQPTDPNAIYFRNLYRTFFYGPFANKEAVADAIKTLDQEDPYWDYDPFCMVHGANPLPKDFVFGFPDVTKEIKAWVESQRVPFKERPFEEHKPIDMTYTPPEK